MIETEAFWELYWETRLAEIETLGKRAAILAASRVIRRLAGRLERPLRLLELGCGEGQILGTLLEAHGHEVVATARDGIEAVARVQVHRPDAVLMDIRMPRCDGLAATRLIMAELPDTQIIILTTAGADEALFEAVRSGASGYLVKSVSGDELMAALAGLEQGVPPFSPGLAARLLREFARQSAPGGGRPPVRSPDSQPSASEPGTRPTTDASHPRGDEPLTARQVDVLRAVATGLTYKEAGARLGLSERTVRYHMAEIMDALHLAHRSEVIAYAGRMGLKPEPS